MRISIHCAAVALVTLAAVSARGDGLFYRLPKDGTWAQYNYDMSVKTDDERVQVEGLIRVASVGRVVEGGKPCRWIELRLEVQQEEEELDTTLVKFLVPEEHFKKGENPLEHVVRGWARFEEDEPAKELKDPGRFFDDLPALLWLGKPLENRSELAATTIRGKLGSLPCKGIKGALESRVGAGTDLRAKIEQRLHSKATLGVVDSHGSFEIVETGVVMAKASFDLVLADFGTGAKSELPKRK